MALTQSSRKAAPNSDDAVSRAWQRLSSRCGHSRSLILLLLLPLIALGIPSAMVSIHNLMLSEGQISRAPSSWWYLQGQSIPVSLKLGTTERPPAPAGAMVALDVSGSMGSPNSVTELLYQAVAATRVASSVLLGGGASVGFLEFDSRARLMAPIGSNPEALANAWAGINWGDGTSVASAVRASLDHFKQQAATHPSWTRKMLVLITDGNDNAEALTGLATEAEREGISIIAIGVGGAADRTYFPRALKNSACSPDKDEFSDTCMHRYTCCQADPDHVAEFLFAAFIDMGLAKAVGSSGRLVDYPHLSAFPYDEEESRIAAGGTGRLPPSAFHGNEVEFRFSRLLDPSPAYAYALSAKSWGIHPVGSDAAVLTFFDTQGNPVKWISGPAQWVLVVPIWLLLLLFLPLILYAALAPFSGIEIEIGDPRMLPPLPGTQPQLQPQVRRFRFDSLDPLVQGAATGMRPTVLIGIGQRGGEMLAALLANRREVGLSITAPDLLPLFVDVRPRNANDMPEAEAVRLPGDIFRHIPEVTDLTNLIEHITSNPSDHLAVLSWFPAAQMVGRAQGLAEGCGGDRRLARLALYADLRDEAPRLHALRSEVIQWCNTHPYAQVMLLAGAAEDVGSGWLMDIGFHLRQAFGSKVVPLLAVLDSTPNFTHASPSNLEALSHELAMVQSSDLPWYGLDRTPQGRVDAEGGSVVLPLFDRVILPTRDGAPAGLLPIGALVLELCDEGARRAFEERLASIAWHSRSASRRDTFANLTGVDVAAAVLPLENWRERWSLWALRDTIAALLGIEERDGELVIITVDPPSSSGIWTEIDRCCRHLGLPCFADWAATFVGQPPQRASHLGPLRDLTVMAAAYLNGSDRIHRPASVRRLMALRMGRLDALSNVLRGIGESGTGAFQTAATKMVAELGDWRSGLLHAEDGRNLGVLQRIARRLHVLDQLEHNESATPVSRHLPPIRKWLRAPESIYGSLKAATVDSGELPSCLWWLPSAQEPGRLDLMIIGNARVRMNRKDAIEGGLERQIKAHLEKSLLSAMPVWAVEDWLSPRTAGSLVQDAGLIGQQRSLILHAVQDEKVFYEIARQAASLADCRTAQHLFSDRLVGLAITEVARIGIETGGESQTVQPAVASALAMRDRVVRYFGAHRAVADLSPPSLLLCTRPQILETAIAALVLERVAYTEIAGNVWQFRFKTVSGQIGGALDVAGAADPIKSVLRLVIIGRDLDGGPISAGEVYAEWFALDRQTRSGRLAVWLDSKQARYTDSLTVLVWKARLDLQDEGGLLL